MKALFVTYNDINDPFTGGNLCSHRNFKMVSEYYETDVYFVENTKWDKLVSFSCLYFPPITSKDKKKLKLLIEEKKYDLVFFNSSLFGKIIKTINKSSNFRIISFFHNVEYDYVSVRFGHNIIKLPYLLSAYYNEKYTLKFSSATIVLNERDKRRVKSIYKQEPTKIIPITIEDEFVEKRVHDFEKKKENKFLLFIGSLNRSNYDAVIWFKENVMRKLSNVDLYVVGKNFETVKEKIETENIKVIGTVERLDDFYYEALAVVSPINHGAGMKVKIAEALMYGKTIFGSEEAFEGYELTENATILCVTAQDYIQKISSFINANENKFNPYSRALFERLYSFDGAVEKFGHILSNN